MRDHAQAPTGLARRGRRISDTETEQRMLQAAVAMVHRNGLTVSLDHISFEDVIRDAGVARSAVYRRWPYKDLFFSDLVKELAKEAIQPGIIADETSLLRRIVAEHPDALDTPQGRHNLLTELFRQMAILDFGALNGSAGWRTYVALQAAFLSLADGELRDQVRAALAGSEQARLTRLADAWEQMASLFGYRLRPETGATTIHTVVAIVDATMRGLIIMAQPIPAIATSRIAASPFGATTVQEWSLPALGIGSVAAAFFEPDPAVEWNDERIAQVRQALAEFRAEWAD